MKSRMFTLPLLVSLTLHGLVLAVVLFAWEGSEERPRLERPNIIQAEVVEFTPRSVRQAEAEAEAERQRVIDMRERQRQREAQEAEQQRQQQAERQRQAREQEQREQRERDERAERERQQRAERERQEQEAERQRQQEAEQRRAEQQRRLDEALAEEDEFLQAEQAATAAQSYVASIQQRIANNWSRPPSARLGMQCVLEIQLVPTGRVVDVRVVESSGNAAFDRSAEQAVQRVGQFEEVRDMQSEVFERHFRRLRLVFNPEDLRL